jgi:hypothetical protein
MLECSVPGCHGKRYGAGEICSKHYQRLRKYGSVDSKKGDHVPLEEKFWQNVDKCGASVTPVGTPCWLWTGSAPKGYGRVWINGKTERAHRAAWIMKNGAIPQGLNVLHRCDTSRCVNVSHLFLGTHADNIEDCINKQRRVIGDHRGEKCWTAKLTAEQVIAIRADPHTNAVVAREYGMDRSTICDIRNRKIWTHI